MEVTRVYGPTPRHQSGATTEHAACRSPAQETSRAATTSPPCPSFASPAAPRSPRTTSARHRRSDPSGPHRSPAPKRGASDGPMRRLAVGRHDGRGDQRAARVPVGDEASVSLVDPSWEIPMVQRTVETRLRAVGAEEPPARDSTSRARQSTEETRPGRVHTAGYSSLRRGSRDARHRPHFALRLVWAGRLTPVRLGRSVRFSCAQLEVFVSSLESGAC